MILAMAVLGLVAACSRPAPLQPLPFRSPASTPTPQVTRSSLPAGSSQPAATFLPPTRLPGAKLLTPTPDAPHAVPTLRVETQQYQVITGDSLGKIANLYGVPLDELIKANKITNPDRIEVGQVLTIPVLTPEFAGSSFKIIPDSELVNGPAAVNFDVAEFIRGQKGFLNTFRGEAEKEDLSGAEIVVRVARDYSVNPRLLLAVLEYQGGWVTSSEPAQDRVDYPVGYPDSTRAGLYKQLAYAANQLSWGYYHWRVNDLAALILTDKKIIPLPATVNAGTVGVQYFFSKVLARPGWEKAVSAQGLFATYQNLFGYPFDQAIEPLLPPGLKQPAMQLPFEKGVLWSFTGGPHGGWGDGSAWAALDFAPPGADLTGCLVSDAWVAAVSPGLIVRSDHGVVVEDLDGDGIEQTGWTVLYLHMDGKERIKAGAKVAAGDRIGHPSCEGGYSVEATHLHLARRYNGEWIPADGFLAFNLEGWISQGAGNQYDGTLNRDGKTIEAWNSRRAENQIER
jgi:LasA protease